MTINDDRFIRRSEIIWEKGTNRSEFFRGEVNKYGWVDTGSSFLPSELISAFLWAQIENMDMIQTRRKEIWEYATNNAHMFYIVCRTLEERTALIKHLKENEILSVFHYLSLHKSGFYTSHSDVRPDTCQGLETIQMKNFDGSVTDETQVVGLDLPNCDRFADCLLRLPLYYELTNEEVMKITKELNIFYSPNFIK